MHGISSRRLASIMGAVLLTFGLLPGSGLLAASMALAATPTHLVFVGGPSNTTNTGSPTPIATFTVHVQDSTNTDVTTGTYGITVAIGTNPGGGTLSGTTYQSTVNGVATFSGLTIDHAGINYTLAATAPTLPLATSAPFTIFGPAATPRSGSPESSSTMNPCMSVAPSRWRAVMSSRCNSRGNSSGSSRNCI